MTIVPFQLLLLFNDCWKKYYCLNYFITKLNGKQGRKKIENRLPPLEYYLPTWLPELNSEDT